MNLIQSIKQLEKEGEKSRLNMAELQESIFEIARAMAGPL